MLSKFVRENTFDHLGKSLFHYQSIATNNLICRHCHGTIPMGKPIQWLRRRNPFNHTGEGTGPAEHMGCHDIYCDPEFIASTDNPWFFQVHNCIEYNIGSTPIPQTADDCEVCWLASK